MTPTYYPLSEICQSAVVIDLESGEIWDYPMISVEPPNACGLVSMDTITHTFFLYWPGGLATYLVSQLGLNHLQPSFIEAAHASAKQMKPFSPIKRRLR